MDLIQARGIHAPELSKRESEAVGMMPAWAAKALAPSYRVWRKLFSRQTTMRFES